MSTWKGGCKPGNGQVLKAKSVPQSKSWPTRCRFWIKFPRTGTVQRLPNHRSLRSLSTKATTRSTSQEARRRIKKSRIDGCPPVVPTFYFVQRSEEHTSEL